MLTALMAALITSDSDLPAMNELAHGQNSEIMILPMYMTLCMIGCLGAGSLPDASFKILHCSAQKCNQLKLLTWGGQLHAASWLLHAASWLARTRQKNSDEQMYC